MIENDTGGPYAAGAFSEGWADCFSAFARADNSFGQVLRVDLERGAIEAPGEAPVVLQESGPYYEVNVASLLWDYADQVVDSSVVLHTGCADRIAGSFGVVLQTLRAGLAVTTSVGTTPGETEASMMFGACMRSSGLWGGQTALVPELHCLHQIETSWGGASASVDKSDVGSGNGSVRVRWLEGHLVLSGGADLGGRVGALELFDVGGRRILRTAVDFPASARRLEVPVEGLAAGVYFVRLSWIVGRLAVAVVVLR